MENTLIKVDIISGFLGAGKTTLINKLLAGPLQEEKVVLIENEFGEIGVDDGFLKETGINIKEMNSGCICCSLSGRFTEALGEVAKQFAPDRILIEPSGVGKLSDVRKAVEEATGDGSLKLHTMTTVVDATKIERYSKYIAEFYDDQVGGASTVILSRTQNLSEEERIQAVERLREINATATMITTPWEELSGAQILEAMEDTDSLQKALLKETAKGEHHEDADDCCDHEHEEDGHEHHHHHDEEEHEHHHHHDEEEHKHHHHHHADDIFVSWGKETPRSYTRDEVSQILEELGQKDSYGDVLRAKGILPCTDGSWIYFDYVPEEYEIRSGVPDYTGRICVIGEELQEKNLEYLFLINR